MKTYAHLSNNREGWNKRGGEAKNLQITKRRGWNKCGGWKIFMKSINVEGGFYLWRAKFLKLLDK